MGGGGVRSQLIAISGRVWIIQTDLQGNVIQDYGWTPNQVTNYAAQAIAQWLIGRNNTGYSPVAPPAYTELGTGTGTLSASDTNLFSPVAATNQRCSSFTNPSPNVAQWTSQYVGTANNAGSYTEEGLFDQSGNLWAHLLQALTITQALSTTLVWQFTVTV